MSIRDNVIECMPRDELKALQSKRLVKQVKKMYDRVECFRLRMDEKGLKPEDIHGVEDCTSCRFRIKRICATITLTAYLPSL